MEAVAAFQQQVFRTALALVVDNGPLPEVDDGTRYRLVDADGRYLHESLTCMTEDRRWAWRGSKRQLEAARARCPLAFGLRSIRIVTRR